jgi:hypothetical protein
MGGIDRPKDIDETVEVARTATRQAGGARGATAAAASGKAMGPTSN